MLAFFFEEGFDMAFFLIFQYFIDLNQYTRFFHFTEFMVDSRTEYLHLRRKTHIGIYQWRDINTKFPDFLIQYLIIILEIIIAEQLFHPLYICIGLQRTNRGYQMFFILKMMMQEIQNHIPSLRIIGIIHPLCATIHLAGSTMKIVACAMAILLMSGEPITLTSFAGFILMLGITMVAAPGVPGGAIMAALGLLQSMLGFNETLQALMIALYIAMDSFGTACNVTGDGAIAILVDKIAGKTVEEEVSQDTF